MRVKAAQNKVCTETEAVFNSEFWTSQDVVATALVSLVCVIFNPRGIYYNSLSCYLSTIAVILAPSVWWPVTIDAVIVYFSMHILAFYLLIAFCVYPDRGSEWHYLRHFFDYEDQVVLFEIMQSCVAFLYYVIRTTLMQDGMWMHSVWRMVNGW